MTVSSLNRASHFLKRALFQIAALMVEFERKDNGNHPSKSELVTSKQGWVHVG